MATPTYSADRLATLVEKARSFRVGMLTTLDPDGKPWSRPMAIQEVTDQADFYFFTNADADKVAHIARDPRVGIALSAPDDQAYVTLAGTAEVLNDRDKIEALWSEFARAWFPDGPDDVSLRLIRVEADRAEYWDSASGLFTAAWGYLKAVTTGEPATDPPLSENTQVDL